MFAFLLPFPFLSSLFFLSILFLHFLSYCFPLFSLFSSASIFLPYFLFFLFSFLSVVFLSGSIVPSANHVIDIRKRILIEWLNGHSYLPTPPLGQDMTQEGFVKLLASSGSHCTKWADEQHRQAGFESRLVPDLPLPFIPTLIGLRAFDLVSSRVWWEAATNTRTWHKINF